MWYLEICSRQYWQSLWKSDPSIQTSVRNIIAESKLNNLFNFILSSLMVKERMFNVQTLIAESFCLNGTILIVLVLFGSGCCSWVDGSIEMFGSGFIIFFKSLSVFRHSPLHCGNLFRSSCSNGRYIPLKSSSIDGCTFSLPVRTTIGLQTRLARRYMCMGLTWQCFGGGVWYY